MRAVITLLCSLGLANAFPALTFEAVSSLGGPGDSVQGAVIQADGTIVLAANISAGPLAKTGAGGIVLWLGNHGTTLIRAQRVAAEVRDLAQDAPATSIWPQESRAPLNSLPPANNSGSGRLAACAGASMPPPTATAQFSAMIATTTPRHERARFLC